jgi:hypothetical protein
MTGHVCGLGCELPAGHAGDHDDLGGGTWPQEETILGIPRREWTALADQDPGDDEYDAGGGWFFTRNH